MNKKITAAIAFCAMLSIGSASAITITDLYGDKDGFGIGITDGYSQPTWPAAPIVADDAEDAGTITDTILYSDQTWSHSYDISGLSTITAVTLEIMTFAQGYTGLSSLYIDDMLVGTLTDGDTTSETSGPDLNLAWLQIFDISAFAGSLLDGASNLRIDTAIASDWWYLDYSELNITGNAISSVPEPSSLLLLGLGLLVLGYRRTKA